MASLALGNILDQCMARGTMEPLIHKASVYLTGNTLSVPVSPGDAVDLRLAVTSREVVWLFLEQLRSEFVPVFHRLQGSP